MPGTPYRHAHDQPTPIQLVLCLSRFMVNTAAIVQRLEHRDTWRQAVRDPCCRSCSSSQHGEKLQSIAKLDKAQKNSYSRGLSTFGTILRLTVFGMIRRTRGQEVHESSWRRSFPSEDMKTDMKSKVKINMLQPLSYSLPLHCSSFVQAFWCFNNPWATFIFESAWLFPLDRELCPKAPWIFMGSSRPSATSADRKRCAAESEYDVKMPISCMHVTGHSG